MTHPSLSSFSCELNCKAFTSVDNDFISEGEDGLESNF